jgi:hypothetical protein
MWRAENVLVFADSQTSISIAHKIGISLPIVGKWHTCFLENGFVGSYDEHRSEGSRSHDDKKVAPPLRIVLESAPDHGSHWLARRAAALEIISLLTDSHDLRLADIRQNDAISLSVSTPTISSRPLNPGFLVTIAYWLVLAHISFRAFVRGASATVKT